MKKENFSSTLKMMQPGETRHIPLTGLEVISKRQIVSRFNVFTESHFSTKYDKENNILSITRDK